MRGIQALCSALCLIALVGCAQNNGQAKLDWCDYSNSYYAMTKNDCEETQQDHLAMLEKIMEVAEKKQLKTPPGIYAEYGFFLFKKGDTKKAIAFYEKERLAYPESGRFVDMLTRVAQRQLENEKQSEQGNSSASASVQEELQENNVEMTSPDSASATEAQIQATDMTPETGADS